MPQTDAIAATLEAQSSSAAERDELRAAARASLFFFAKYVLGWAGLNDRSHKPLCDFAQSVVTRPGGFGVAEDPRGTGKSTSLTCAIPQWALVQDREECLAKRWLPLGPSTEILIVSYKAEYAAKFLRDGRRAMKSSPVFKWLFGELLPDDNQRGEDAAWKGTAYNVRRPSSATGFSVMALGTDSAATTLHPSIMLIDDLVNEKNYKSHAEVNAQVDWLDHSFDLVESTGGSRLVIENSWTERDVNSSLRDRNLVQPRSVAFFSRSIMICDECEFGRPLDASGNPVAEGHSYEDHPHPERPLLDHRVKEPYAPYTAADVKGIVASLPPAVAWAQHFNHPLNRADLMWREDWLRACTVKGDDVEFHFGESAGRGLLAKEPTRLALDDLDCIVSLDPGIRRPGLACVGHSNIENLGDAIFILEAVAEKLSPRDQIFKLFEWTLRYGATKLVIENAATQSYINETIPAMALSYENERGVTLPGWLRRPNASAKRIIGAQVFKREGDKAQRLEDDLGPIFEQKLAFVRGGLDAFLAEYKVFPKGRSMDILDAIRQAVRQFRAGRRANPAERDRSRLDAEDRRAQYEAVMTEGPQGYGFGY